MHHIKPQLKSGKITKISNFASKIRSIQNYTFICSLILPEQGINEKY